MKQYIGIFLLMLLLLEGCMASTVEDTAIPQPKGFKKYVKPEIYVVDSLLSPPESSKKSVEPEVNSGQPEHLLPEPGGIKDAKPRLEWVSGPDRDTTWDEARSWVQNLSIGSGDWRMPTIKELKTLYLKDDLTLLATATGSWMWSGETKDSSARLFSFRYGIDKWGNRSYSKNNRGFAVRSQR
jgi:hypothetical protein